MFTENSNFGGAGIPIPAALGRGSSFYIRLPRRGGAFRRLRATSSFLVGCHRHGAFCRAQRGGEFSPPCGRRGYCRFQRQELLARSAAHTGSFCADKRNQKPGGVPPPPPVLCKRAAAGASEGSMSSATCLICQSLQRYIRPATWAARWRGWSLPTMTRRYVGSVVPQRPGRKARVPVFLPLHEGREAVQSAPFSQGFSRGRRRPLERLLSPISCPYKK